jgi:hypothetical protein
MKNIFAFVLYNGNIYVGTSPKNDIKKNRIIMQKGIKIKFEKDLPKGDNLEERITKAYSNNSKKKEIFFKTYKFKIRYDFSK